MASGRVPKIDNTFSIHTIQYCLNSFSAWQIGFKGYTAQVYHNKVVSTTFEYLIDFIRNTNTL